jgi:predicted O-linked N-acetylglucosamine transferase (SPINDLY family)
VLKVGGSSKPGAAAPLLSRLQCAGIDPARITLLERTTTQSEHLALYSEMDIALDTFPYHGTTTTCEALLMGVPVISRAGDRHASRVGRSLLTAAGRPQWAVLSDDDFVARAVELAQDPARLASLRRELRPALLASPLCDAPAYGRRFAAALRGLWKNRRSLPRG